MSEVAITLEGWYALHDFRSIDWTAWRTAEESERSRALDELNSFLKQWAEVKESKQGSTAVYAIVGQKADFVFMHLRETLEELNEIETAFNKTAFASFTIPAYSYVSVVELSNYMNQPGTDPMQNPDIVARLKPTLAKSEPHLLLPDEQTPRRQRQLVHARHGRAPHDDAQPRHDRPPICRQSQANYYRLRRLRQLGVGRYLFADDALQFKKLIYEMRFDEVSARYGDFGDFYVGNLL